MRLSVHHFSCLERLLPPLSSDIASMGKLGTFTVEPKEGSRRLSICDLRFFRLHSSCISSLSASLFVHKKYVVAFTTPLDSGYQSYIFISVSATGNHSSNQSMGLCIASLLVKLPLINMK
jgi:hypothetical protein